MGDVIVVLRILPKVVKDSDFAQLKTALEKLKPQRIEEEPIAFGLKSIKFTKIIPDEEGEIDRLEEQIRRMKGVKDVQTLIVSRSL
ncbi:MAG: elongation factor 1-beta [Candidatus Aenigmatarchaeota archaeon]